MPLTTAQARHDQQNRTSKSVSDQLSEPYPLRPEQIAAFARDGYIKLKHVLSPVVLDAYRPLLREVTMQHNRLADVPMEQRNTYQQAFVQVCNLWELDERTRPLIFSKRLARIAADLLNVAAIRLYHDQALYKEASGGFTPWHADQFYWPLATDRTITIWIPLQQTPLEMGPLEFAIASQKFTTGRTLEISDESEQQLQQMIEAQKFPIDRGPFDLGEVSFHLGWTYHRAGPNRTDRCREVMTMIYTDAANTVKQPEHRYQQADWDNFIPGIPIGSAAASAKNPLLFDRQQ
ncbi:MAG: phytanoyl-CoA dioxygenase family protein [Phycisphaeraceae bacterium]|nr:phytanoyl-CoA dioxygenase family protein [Phycisphaeraceae bacterium]